MQATCLYEVQAHIKRIAEEKGRPFNLSAFRRLCSSVVCVDDACCQVPAEAERFFPCPPDNWNGTIDVRHQKCVGHPPADSVSGAAMAEAMISRHPELLYEESRRVPITPKQPDPAEEERKSEVKLPNHNNRQTRKERPRRKKVRKSARPESRDSRTLRRSAAGRR